MNSKFHFSKALLLFFLSIYTFSCNGGEDDSPYTAEGYCYFLVQHFSSNGESYDARLTITDFEDVNNPVVYSDLILEPGENQYIVRIPEFASYDDIVAQWFLIDPQNTGCIVNTIRAFAYVPDGQGGTSSCQIAFDQGSTCFGNSTIFVFDTFQGVNCALDNPCQ